MFYLIIILIVLFLTFILLLPVKLQIHVQENVKIELKIAFLNFLLVGKRKNRIPSLTYSAYKKKLIDLRRDKLKKEKKKKKKEPPPITLDLITSILKAISEILAVLSKKLQKHLHIHVTDMNIIYGSDDAAKTALVTGEIISVTNIVLDIFRSFTHFSIQPNHSIDIQPNFLKNEFTCKLDLIFSIRLGGIFCLLYSLLLISIKYKKLLFTFIR